MRKTLSVCKVLCDGHNVALFKDLNPNCRVQKKAPRREMATGAELQIPDWASLLVATDKHVRYLNFIPVNNFLKSCIIEENLFSSLHLY